MGRDFPSTTGGVDWYMTAAFKLAYVGLGLSVAALIIQAPISAKAEAASDVFLRLMSVLSMLAGLLCAGGAVWSQLTHPGKDNFEERSKTGILVALASGSAMFAYLVLQNHGWDSLVDWMLVLWCVTLAAVPVLLMPRVARRMVVSFLILFHFGGLLTATTAVAVPGQAAPWLPTLVWNNVYRKYLTFAYLNNAYHFYSPEPGPPSLVWFLVEFEDGDPEWIRLVTRDKVATRQQYQRYLSLTESVNQYRPVSYTKTQALFNRRMAASKVFRDRDGVPQEIPLNPWLNAEQQFREPTDLAKEYLVSYAQYVCRTSKSSTKPDAKVKSVKIYRLTHQLITPAQLTSGLSPTDPTQYWAFFFGEYAYHEKDGSVELKTNRFGDKDQPLLQWQEQNENGAWVEMAEPVRDPFLYWMLPIYKIPKANAGNLNDRNNYLLIDTLSIHAGVTIKWEVD